MGRPARSRRDLEHAFDGRAAVEVLTSLRRREARYLALLAAGYSYREIAEREGATYTNTNCPLGPPSDRGLDGLGENYVSFADGMPRGVAGGLQLRPR